MQVPKHRNQPFRTLLFENYKRSEAALIATMAEMAVNGVATRKVERITEKLCGVRFSKSTVSEVCSELLDVVKKFKSRPLEEYYPFMTVDGTYFKVRENHRVISKVMMVAHATNDQGIRNIIRRPRRHTTCRDQDLSRGIVAAMSVSFCKKHKR